MNLLKKIFNRIKRKEENKTFFNYKLTKAFKLKKSDSSSSIFEGEGDFYNQDNGTRTVPKVPEPPIVDDLKGDEVGANVKSTPNQQVGTFSDFDRVVNLVKSNIGIINDDNFSILSSNFINREGIEEYQNVEGFINEEKYKDDFIVGVFSMLPDFTFDDFSIQYISAFDDSELYELSKNISERLGGAVDAKGVFLFFECLKRKEFYNLSRRKDKIRTKDDARVKSLKKDTHDDNNIDKTIEHPGRVFENKMDELIGRGENYIHSEDEINFAVEKYKPGINRDENYINAISDVFYGVGSSRGGDKKFEFFLENPIYLREVLDSDPTFAGYYEQFIESGSSKKQICEYISYEKGNELIQKLNNLIRKENPDIFSWINKRYNQINKGEREGGGRANNFLEDDKGNFFIPEDERGKNVKFTEEEVSSNEQVALYVASNSYSEFLKDDIQNIKYVKSDIFESPMNEYASIINKSPNKKEISEIYSSYEVLNLYLSKMTEQFDFFLSNKDSGGKLKEKFIKEKEGDREVIEGVMLKNGYGRMYINIRKIFEVLMEIKSNQNIVDKYPEIERYDISSLSEKDIRDIIQIYKREYPKSDHNIFNIQWSSVLATNSIGENNSILYMVKKIILENKKFVDENIENNPSVIVRHFLESAPYYQGFRDNLMNVSGVNEGDSREEINLKIYNFVKMTIYQEKYDLLNDISMYEKFYRLKSMNEQLREQLKKEKNPYKIEKIKINIIEHQRDIYKEVQNQRVRLQEHFRKDKNNVLGNLFSVKKEKDIPDSVTKSIIDSFYPPTAGNEFRRFVGGQGMKKSKVKDENGIEKELYNTEIYFYLRGEQIPEDIKYLMAIHKKGIETVKKITPYRSEAALLKVDSYNKYNYFFFYINENFKCDEKINKNLEFIKEQENEIEKRLQDLNKNISLFFLHYKILNNMSYNEAGIRKILRQKGVSSSDIRLLLSINERFNSLSDIQKKQIIDEKSSDNLDYTKDVSEDKDGRNVIYNVFLSPSKTKVVNSIKNNIEQAQARIKELENQKEILKIKAKGVLPDIQKDIPDLDLDKLRLACAIFNNMMKKISSLRKIQMSNIKISYSRNIEQEIDDMYNDFGILFKRFFIGTA